MKLTINKIILIKFLRLLKRGKIAAKFAAIGAAITGAVTALSGSATTGVAMSAAGATAYAASKGVPSQGYEKTKHIPPGRVDKTANLLRQQEMDSSGGGKQRKPGKQDAMQKGYSKQPAARGAMSHPPTHIPRKK